MSDDLTASFRKAIRAVRGQSDQIELMSLTAAAKGIPELEAVLAEEFTRE